MTDTADKPTPPAPRRRRWLRRLAVAAITLLVLGLLGIVAAVLVLRSSLPERIVEREATHALGVRVQVDDVDVGIFGSTTVRGLRATMPLEDEPFLVVPEATARHTSLPMLLFRSPQLHRLAVRSPVLALRQRPSGAWNLEQVANRLGAQATRSSGPAPSSLPDLPTITLDDATVRITPRDAATTTLEHVQLRTDGSDPLVYQLKLDVPGRIDLSGTILPGGDWRQNLAFRVRDLEPLLAPFLGPLGLPANAAAAGTWTGRLDRGTPAGQLALDEITYADLAGSLRTTLSLGRPIVANPSSATFLLAGQTVRVSGGRIALDGDDLRVAGLNVHGLGGVGGLDGRLNLADQSGAADFTFRDLQLQDVRSSGTARVTLAREPTGGRQLAVSLDTRGNVGPRRFSSLVTLDATGPTFQQMRWTARARDTQLVARRTYALPELLARGRHDIDDAGNATLLVDSLAVPGRDVLAGSGGVVVRDNEAPLWWGWAYARELLVDLPRVGERAMLLNANLWGRGLQANILDVYASLGDAELFGDGVYDRGRGPQALQLALTIRKLTPLEADPRLQFVRGVLWGNATLTGELHPLALDFTGQAYTRNLLLGRRPVGDVAAVVVGTIQPAAARFRSRDITLFQGSWDFDLDVPFEERDRVRLQLVGSNVPAQELGQFARIRNLVGDLDLDLDARLTTLSLDGLSATASVRGERVGFTRYVLDEITLPATLEAGVLTARPTIRKGDGSGSATLTNDLRTPSRMTFQGELVDWPVTPERAPASARVTARSDPIRIDLDAPLEGDRRGVSLDGNFQLATVASLNGRGIADLQLRGAFERRSLVIPDVNGELVGGRVGGGGRVHFDQLADTVIDLRFNDLQADRLLEIVPEFDGLAGSFDGVFRVAPPSRPRPLGPLQLDVNLFAFDARYRSVAIGNSFLTGYFERSGETRLPFNRFVTDASSIRVAGGEIRPFVRVSRRDGNDYWSHLNVEFENLDLRQLVQLGMEDPRDIGGQLGGTITAFGNLADPLTVTAEATARVDRASVASLPVLRQVFAAANVFGPDQDEKNVATLDAHFGNDTLSLRRAEVFDRGLYIQGINVQLVGLTRWPQTELSGFALATARPLRSVQLPFFDTLFENADGILNVLQQQATTVRLGGTVGDYTVTPAALSEVFSAIRGMLGNPAAPQ